MVQLAERVGAGTDLLRRCVFWQPQVPECTLLTVDVQPIHDVPRELVVPWLVTPAVSPENEHPIASITSTEGRIATCVVQGWCKGGWLKGVLPVGMVSCDNPRGVVAIHGLHYKMHGRPTPLVVTRDQKPNKLRTCR